MATLRMSFFTGLFRPGETKGDDASRRARLALKEVHKKTGGPTPELKRVYGAYLDNERRREQQRRKG